MGKQYFIPKRDTFSVISCSVLVSQELTGSIPSDFPLMPDEKPPRVRRRIGASFKLDEGLIHQDQQVPAATSSVLTGDGLKEETES